MSKSETTLCVARLEGGEYETLPKSEVKRRLRSGIMRQSQYIWHPSDQSWRQARDFTELIRPTGPIAAPDPSPQPTPRVVAVPRPKSVVVAATAGKPSQTQAVAAPKPVTTVSLASDKARKTQLAEASGDKMVAALYGNHRRRQIIYGVITLLIIGVIALVNLVEHLRMKSALVGTEFQGVVKVGAHYAYFVQPRALMLQLNEVPAGMNNEKFVDMLTALAVRTQEQPITGMTYFVVKLQKGSTIKYVLRGEAWKELANERNGTSKQRAFLLINNLYFPDGRLVVGTESDNLSEAYSRKTDRFIEFCRTFIP